MTVKDTVDFNNTVMNNWCLVVARIELDMT